VLAAALLAGCSSAPRDPRPDLLLISIDTLRADRLACYGGGSDVGRALCRIFERGTRFVWAFSTAPSTAPSVASILTSRYPSQHGVSRFAVSFLAGEAVTLAEQLRGAGYTTAAFICNPVLDRARNLGQGFDVYDDRMTHRDPHLRQRTDREARAATEAALSWLRGAESPWFLWIHYQDPHGPYDPPEAPEPSRDEEEGRALPVLRDNSGHGGIPAYQALPNLFTAAAYERRYLDEIRYLDAQLERLIAAVDARGRPVGILLTADHGEAFGEDGGRLLLRARSLRGPRSDPGAVTLAGAGQRRRARDPHSGEHARRRPDPAGGRRARGPTCLPGPAAARSRRAR